MADKSHALCVGTLNVRGLSARRRQYQLSRLLLDEGLDLVAVQETKVESQEHTDRMVQPFTTRYYVCVSHAIGMSAGCVIFVRNSLGIVIEAVVTSEVGRFVVVDFLYIECRWRIICVYAPNKENDRNVFFFNQ